MSARLLLLLAVFYAPAAQARDLHWKSLTVTAELDADGVLHVIERQDMVMTGDWNGGERIFTLGPGQDVVLHGMTRIDPVRGTRRAMVEGDTHDVDEYAWIDGTTLRWRSRLPDDAAFDREDLVYELDYSVYGVLEERDGTYVLAHDFAFANRAGTIQDHVATLRVDPAWSIAGPREQTFHPGRLEPGTGHRVILELTRSASAEAPSLPGSPARARLLLALGGVPLLLALSLVASEWVRGRLAPLTPELAAPEGWLEANVLCHPAEVIGAVWDRGVGSEEVAALVACLTAEHALETRVDDAGDMQLTLKVTRETWGDYERALIDGFFFDGRTHTSTGLVREHYAKTGFDPAGLIRPGLEARVAEVVGPSARRWWLPLWLPTVFAYWGGMYLLWSIPGPPGSRLPRLLGIGLPTLIVGGIGMGLAGSWRGRIDRGLVPMVGFLIPIGLLIAFGWALVGGLPGLSWLASTQGPQARLGATLIVLGLVNSIVNSARSRERVQGIALRKRLASARRFFEQQLEHPQPALKDEWFPYLLAFGLDEEAQDWFEAYGGQSSSTSSWTGSSSGGGSSGSSPSSWSGGGGAFGGAGASGSWAAAAGSLSSSIAAPSSGGSGGGGGGGSSGSGGGGGGGW